MLRPFAHIAMVTALLCAGIGPASAQDSTPVAPSANPFAGLGLPEIAVTITNDAFEGVPTELTAGRYLLTVTNALESSEEETSGAALLRLPRNVTAAEFVAVVRDAESETWPAGWYDETQLAGGPYAVLGGTAYAVVDLTAGEWMLWGEAPGAPRAPVQIPVTGAFPVDPPTPVAGLTIELSEFRVTFSAPLASGPQVIEVVNTGEQPHFLFVGGVPDGTTVDDALAAFEAFWNPTASPAASFSFAETPELLGTGDQSAGVTAWYAVDFPGGTVVVACFVTDPETGMPHAMLGMTEIVVIE